MLVSLRVISPNFLLKMEAQASLFMTKRLCAYFGGNSSFLHQVTIKSKEDIQTGALEGKGILKLEGLHAFQSVKTVAAGGDFNI